MAVVNISALKGTLNKITDFSTSLTALTSSDGAVITTPNAAQTVVWIQNSNTGSSAVATITVTASAADRYISKGIGNYTTTVNDYAMFGPWESSWFNSTANTITIECSGSTAVTGVSMAAMYLR